MTRASAFVLGYHGCGKTVGEKALANQEHLRSERQRLRLAGNWHLFLGKRRAASFRVGKIREGAAFIEGLPLYENAGFHEQTHIQICVRKPEQIIGYFRPIVAG
jgi:hypothetical protein